MCCVPKSSTFTAYSWSSTTDLASEEFALLGTPAEIIARLQKLEAGRVDYVLLVEPTASTAALERFAKDIMPHFDRTLAAAAAEERP
jgi:alkanesulfonate monooxygenase SsuD/methylene tetrahydromethanopterin reductase-like flavin-dependent oxidoreductase (luciferase family)